MSIYIYSAINWGIGDLLCLTPSLVELTKNNKVYFELTQIPRSKVSILENIPNLNIITFKKNQDRKKILNKCEKKYFIGEVIRGRIVNEPCTNSELSEINKYKTKLTSRAVIFARRFNLKLNSYLPKFFPSEKEIEKINTLLKINDKKNIGFQLNTAQVIKDYPHNTKLIMLLTKEYKNKYNIWTIKKGIISNINSKYEDKLTLRETITFLTKMNLIITPDTYSLHASGINNTKTILILGLQSNDQYKRYNTDVISKSKMSCYPCNRYMGKDCKYKVGNTNLSRCMCDIQPEEIMRKVRKELKWVTKN